MSTEAPFTRPITIKEGYILAQSNLLRLTNLGFHIQEAGIAIPASAVDVDYASKSLSDVLGAHMKAGIPHYFITLTPPQSSGLPAYVARTITSIKDDGEVHSLVKEYGVEGVIDFEDKAPYCHYKAIGGVEEPNRLFYSAIGRMKKRGELEDQNIVLLAGIGRVRKDVNHGSNIISLARIALALVDWGFSNPADPLFILSTTRLTNENPDNPVPQAYLLDRLFRKIKLRPNWLGVAVVRRGAERSHPTGAVIVQILPQDYEKTIEIVRMEYNSAVENMQKNVNFT